MKRETHHILLADDDVGQQFLSKRALDKAITTRSTISLVDSGKAAIAYIKGEGEFANRELHPFPTIVITDLNMPDGDGFDLLEFMQGNQEWSVVPRIIMSSSTEDDDVRVAYLLGVSAYHVKGSGRALEECMERIVDYWTSCEVPPVDRAGRLLVTTSLGGPGKRYPQP
jgi:CheY-like chemotaxis protein